MNEVFLKLILSIGRTRPSICNRKQSTYDMSHLQTHFRKKHTVLSWAWSIPLYRPVPVITPENGTKMKLLAVSPGQ